MRAITKAIAANFASFKAMSIKRIEKIMSHVVMSYINIFRAIK